MDASASDSNLLDPAVLDALDGRVERFRRTFDPAHLWPGLPERQRVSAANEIERVTRLMLAGAGATTLDTDHQHSPYAIAVAAHTTGMGPLLGSWVANGQLYASEEQSGKLRDHLEHARRRERRIARDAGPALGALCAAGLRPIALKGFHTGRLLFAEPALRRMSDVDLFIPPEDAPRAARALEGIGYTRLSASSDARKTDWIAPGVSTRTHSLEVADEFTRWTLEIHTSLDSVFYRGAVARLDALVGDTVPLVVDGRTLDALAPENLLILLACHCSELEANRLLRVYELALLTRRGLDWDRVLALLATTGAARFTWPALSLVENLAPNSIDPRVLAIGRKQSTWAARHTVQRLTPAGGRIGDIGLFRQLMWAQGKSALLERAGKFLWPTRAASGLTTSGWRMRYEQLRAGRLSVTAPDERTHR